MNKKIIIIASIICTLIIITCLVLIITMKKEDSSIKFDSANTNYSNNKQNDNTTENSIKYAERITDVKIVYNVGKCINEMLKDFYATGEYDYPEAMLLPSNLIKKMDYANGIKTYYIKQAYKSEQEDGIIVYFTDGYIVNEQAEKLEKENLSLTFINDTEYNTGRLYVYGDGFSDSISYNDDISKTSVFSNKGLKIKKSEEGTKQLDEILMEDDFYQNRTVEENMYENDLVVWYYKDYKIQKAIEKNESYNGNVSISYSGNYDEGYTIKENDQKQYYIKPGSSPMEYEITEK